MKSDDKNQIDNQSPLVPPLPEPRRVKGFFPYFDLIKEKISGITSKKQMNKIQGQADISLRVKPTESTSTPSGEKNVGENPPLVYSRKIVESDNNLIQKFNKNEKPTVEIKQKPKRKPESSS